MAGRPPKLHVRQTVSENGYPLPQMHATRPDPLNASRVVRPMRARTYDSEVDSEIDNEVARSRDREIYSEVDSDTDSDIDGEIDSERHSGASDARGSNVCSMCSPACPIQRNQRITAVGSTSSRHVARLSHASKSLASTGQDLPRAA